MLRKIDLLRLALNVHLPTQADGLAEKIRDWAKKINRDPDIRQLQKMIPADTNRNPEAGENPRRLMIARAPFVSVSVRSRVGAQVEIWLQQLPINELDWDDSVYSLIVSRVKQS